MSVWVGRCNWLCAIKVFELVDDVSQVIDERVKYLRFVSNFGQYEWVVRGDQLVVARCVEVKSGA